ncbi:hypothetical protein FRC02_004909 [Tulasnella sp. 418]|nr:hypothetical protein FRC02_004909 [Tulasnella sp. 418]
MALRGVQRTPECSPEREMIGREAHNCKRTERAKQYDEEVTKAQKQTSNLDSESESEDEEFEDEGFDSPEKVISQKTKVKTKKRKQTIVSDDEQTNRGTYMQNIESHHASMAESPKARAPPAQLSNIITKHHEKSLNPQDATDSTTNKPRNRPRSDSCPPELSPECAPHQSSKTPVAGHGSSPTVQASLPPSHASPNIRTSSPAAVTEDHNNNPNKKKKKCDRSESSSSDDEPKKKAKRNSGATAPQAGRSAAHLDDIDGTGKAVLDVALLIYCTMLAAKDPFPDQQSEDKMARWAWDDACTQLQIDEIPINKQALRLIKLCTSQMQGEVVTIVKANMNLYGLSNDASKFVSNKCLYRKLSDTDNYDYEKKFGVFYHPILFTTVHQMWFKLASHEGPMYPRYFRPIRALTIALVYAAVHNALDEWENGCRMLKHFQAKQYAPIYEELLDALERLDEKHKNEFVDELGETLYERSMNTAGLLPSSNSKSTLTAEVIDQAMSDARKIRQQFAEEAAKALEEAQQADDAGWI